MDGVGGEEIFARERSRKDTLEKQNSHKLWEFCFLDCLVRFSHAGCGRTMVPRVGKY